MSRSVDAVFTLSVDGQIAGPVGERTGDPAGV